MIGGGMHAPAEFRELSLCSSLPGRMTVISANGHAFKLGLCPDFIVCKDDVHTETKERMEDVLRPHGVPIISPQPWADYRLSPWPYQGNSGLHAILCAVAMGADLVLPVGFDFYLAGTYWHDPDAPNISRGRSQGDTARRLRNLKMLTTGARIRGFSGHLATAFGRFDPREAFLPREKAPIEYELEQDPNESVQARDRRRLKYMHVGA